MKEVMKQDARDEEEVDHDNSNLDTFRYIKDTRCK